MINKNQNFVKKNDFFAIIVSGNSMEPILCDGEYILAKKDRQYKIGDILIFSYKQQAILVHRLLKINAGRYFCKGDNSFRIEDVSYEQILGKVIISNDVNNNFDFITASLEIGNIMRCCGYDTNKVMATEAYKKYKEKYLSEIKTKNHL